MPKLGLTMKKGSVGKWFKKEGEEVKKGEVLFEVLTDKITAKVESPAEGILTRILVPSGNTVPVGATLGIIAAPGENIEHLLDEEASEAEERVKASPIARKLAQEYGLDLANIQGTGPGGRITKEDVERARLEQAGKGELPVDERKARNVVPFEGIRRIIAENMVKSHLTAAQVTLAVAVDMGELMEYRRKANENLLERERLSVTDFLIKATACALERYPYMNATLCQEGIKELEEINIGVAVATEKGLFVPVIREANRKTLGQISAELKKLVQKARRDKLLPDDLEGGTFTISNLGMYAVDIFTPIINPPETAILGAGRTVDTPVVFQGQICIRPIMHLSLSFDHRLVDGAPAAAFLTYLKDLLEHPHKIFI